jgi:hypothetical protein
MRRARNWGEKGGKIQLFLREKCSSKKGRGQIERELSIRKQREKEIIREREDAADSH